MALCVRHVHLSFFAPEMVTIQRVGAERLRLCSFRRIISLDSKQLRDSSLTSRCVRLSSASVMSRRAWVGGLTAGSRGLHGIMQRRLGTRHVRVHAE